MTEARRFYQHVSIALAEGAFAVMLDERELKSPAGVRVRVPTSALAGALAAEWDAHTERIRPLAMPLTQLAFATVDGGPGAREQRIAYVGAFAETDLCCHRAEAPAELTAQQEAIWGPLVRWAEDYLQVTFPVVAGVIARPAPRAVAAVEARARDLDDFSLTGLAQAVGLSGSAVIGLAMLRGRVSAEAAFAAATLDEAWNMARWGYDDEAAARLERTRAVIAAAARFLEALGHGRG
jgi:chaperone required for assembly of F1-ATPase